jgi:hypothetical protein
MLRVPLVYASTADSADLKSYGCNFLNFLSSLGSVETSAYKQNFRPMQPWHGLKASEKACQACYCGPP